MSSPIRLDAFELEAPLGRGAMGEVWRAVHRVYDVPVAVKLLKGAAPQAHKYGTTFRDEVQAVAALDHPGIVRIFDYGQISAAASKALGGRCAPGNPYLVMELVTGGDLNPMRGRIGWPMLPQLLLGLLDALGHAHARGVVHRDLKPANVLLTEWNGEFPQVKLTDFGLAHAVRRALDDERLDHAVGTPNYMSPEQILARWRDYGPWTDLYGVGCVAFAMVAGRGPFYHPTMQAILRGHLEAAPPPMVLREMWPPQFETWVRRLLEKRPSRRYQCAADAAWALLHLDDGVAPMTADEAAPTMLDLRIVDRGAVVGPDEPTTRPALRRHTLTWSRLDRLASSEAGDGHGLEVPPIAADWRRDDGAAWHPLVGAGIGLFGIRAIPMVGREPERDRLWQILHLVGQHRMVRAVVLRGSAGHGKSRLAEWLAERAEELGAAWALSAVHGPDRGPSDGLGRMFVRHHRGEGLSRGDLVARLGQVLAARGDSREESRQALANALSTPIGDDDAPQMRASERYGVFREHLERLAHERPLILWLDDVQWGDDALAFARWLLDQPDELPVLIVATVGGTHPASTGATAPDSDGPLGRLLTHPLAATIDVGPLPDDEMPALVQALLGLDCELSAEVVARSEGSPLFAIQLVADWVHRGSLRPGATGFRLHPGVSVRIPDVTHEIWTERLDHVLDGRTAADRLALELAATLGHSVDPDEWIGALAAARVVPSDDLVERLVERRLARKTVVPWREGHGIAWRLDHALLRESLVRRAEEAGRLVGHHRACAAMLARDDIAHGSDAAERRARHLLAAGDTEAALEPLIDAAWARLLASEFDAARQLFRTWNEQLALLALPPGDARRAAGWSFSCRLARVTGDLERARRLARAAAAEARTYGWHRALARALVDRAWDAVNEGEWSTGVGRLEEAATLAEDAGDLALLASCRRNQGVFLLDRGDPEHVERRIEAALSIYEHLGRPTGAALSLVNLAQLARRHGRFDQASAFLERAQRLFAGAGARWGVAMALTEWGIVAFEQGATGVACDQLRSAMTRYEQIGGVNAPLPSLYLAWVNVTRGRYDEARYALTPLRRLFGRQARHGRELQVILGLMAADAGEGRWRDWIDLLRDARDRVDRLQIHTRDGARMAERVGRLAAGASDRAAEAWALALRQWRALGADAEAEGAAQQIATSGTAGVQNQT